MFSDIMAKQDDENERQHLSMFVRSQTKYGTTYSSSSKCGGNVPLAEKATRHIKHVVLSGDTLMGIALKYQVTVEQIKRLNKLWTNDSLFLRAHILVPLLPSNEQFIPEHLIVKISDISDRYNSSSETEEEQKADVKPSKSENGMDFLNKYDLNIAKLKSNLEKIEKKSGNNDVNNGMPQVRHHNIGSKYELPVDRDTEC